MLELASLSRAFGGLKVIDGLDFKVESGEIVGILGPNGAGKTTLLKAISRTVPPRSGRVVFNGLPLEGLPAYKVVGRGICHCPEGRRLFPELSVLKNLMLGAYLRNDRQAIARDLDKVHSLFPVLEARAGQQANTLSGGEQQMLAIARALMMQPKLLILDEPVSALDAANRVQVLGGFAELRDEGIAQLYISHDLGSVAGICDRTAVLYQGRIVEYGPTAEIVNNPRHPYTRLLVGSAPTLRGTPIDRKVRAQLRAELAAETS